MKKILILAYDFPPLNSVAAERPHFWMKEFHKEGYYPIVITRSWNSSIIDSSEKDIIGKDASEKTTETKEYTLIQKQQTWSLKPFLLQKLKLNVIPYSQKILTFLELISRFRYDLLDDKKFIYTAGKEYLQHNKVDFILATGEPFLTFKYANKLSKEFKTPWIADYRDGWSSNHHGTIKGVLQKLIVSLDRRSEKRIVSNALFTTTVNSFCQKSIEQIVNRKCYIIQNGVDLDIVDQIQLSSLPNHFIIHYGGTIYDVSYIDVLIEGINELNKRFPDNKTIVFEFYGITFVPNKAVDRLIELSKTLPNWIKIYPRVSGTLLIPAMQKANLFLDLIIDKPINAIGTKTYTYLASRRPNIVIPTVLDKATRYSKENTQVIVFNAKEFADEISKYYHLYNTGVIQKNEFTDEDIYNISRNKGIKELANVLNQYNKD
ncbi:MAG: hypothetical protein RIQ62_274 [Bacteroidota bacterium]|jgi:glycosyltransferase involved in cell wall biosynthesis